MLLIAFSIAIYFLGFLTILALQRVRSVVYGWIALLCAGASLASIAGLWLTQELPHEFIVRSITLAGIEVQFGFIADHLSLLGVFLVNAIAFLVFLYAQDYMSEDPSRQRFFAKMCLFAGSMLGILLSVSLLQMFVFWELVGLSSYLLIGFWYERPWVAKAAQKVFTLIMFGDVVLLGGILLLARDVGSMNFSDLVAASSLSEQGWLGLLLIILGAFVKSAQAPFFFWLPWAMEGPTPVSALLHAATMVKAGAFLALRLAPLIFLAQLESMVLVIAFTTIFLASGAALAERDIKRVLAYSTISQLGFIFLALGLAHPETGLFHLVNDAFYKALLFVGAGVVIHAGGSRNLFELAPMRGGPMRLFMALIGIGVLGIAGFMPLGAFFSKDAILEAARSHGVIVFGATLFASLLTGLYIFRWFFLIFKSFVRVQFPSHAEHGGRELFGLNTKIAMSVLAAGVIMSGIAGRQFLPKLFYGVSHPHFDGAIALASVGIIAAALFLSFMVYIKETPRSEFLARFFWGIPYRLALDGFGVARFAEYTARASLLVASFLSALDKMFIDRILDAAPAGARYCARATRFIDRKILDTILERGVSFVVRFCFGVKRFDWSVIDGAVRLVGFGFGIFASYSQLLVNGLLNRYLFALIFGAIALILLFNFVL